MNDHQKKLLLDATDSLNDTLAKVLEWQTFLQRIKDMPRNCLCNPADWFGRIGDICWTFEPEAEDDDSGTCKACGHLEECHRASTTKRREISIPASPHNPRREGGE